MLTKSFPGQEAQLQTDEGVISVEDQTGGVSVAHGGVVAGSEVGLLRQVHEGVVQNGPTGVLVHLHILRIALALDIGVLKAAVGNGATDAADLEGLTGVGVEVQVGGSDGEVAVLHGVQEGIGLEQG